MGPAKQMKWSPSRVGPSLQQWPSSWVAPSAALAGPNRRNRNHDDHNNNSDNDNNYNHKATHATHGPIVVAGRPLDSSRPPDGPQRRRRRSQL